MAPELGTKTLAASGIHLELSVVPAQLLASGLVAWQVTEDFSNHSLAAGSKIVKPRPQPHLHRGVHHGHHGCQPQQARSSTQFCVHLRPFSRSCHAAVPSRLSFRSYPVSPSNPNFPNAAESETLLGEPKPIVVFTCPRN